MTMAEYRLDTVWQIEAPLEAVYTALSDPLRWPEWWPAARRVEQRHAGAADGVGRTLHCTWQGRLPYQLSFDLLTTRMQPLIAVEGMVKGDLEGGGRCLFSQEGAITTIRHEWYVSTTRRWMNILAPCISPWFKHNHAMVMKCGGEGLARRLNARLLCEQQIDLGAKAAPHADDWLAAVGAALAAGVIATALEIALWWLSAIPVPEMLFRDTRLTAAIVMGPAALLPSNTLHWDVILVASLIHFTLSITYGLILARLVGRMHMGRSLLAGGLCGMVLYVINLYGFTAIFPWFSVARDWITALTHVAFGTILAGGYLALRSRHAPTAVHKSHC